MNLSFISSVHASGASAKIAAADPISGLDTIAEIVNKILPVTIIIGGLILLVMIIYAGFTMLTSVDNPDKTESGKKILTTAFAGFFILFAAYWIAQALEVILGIPLLGE